MGTGGAWVRALLLTIALSACTVVGEPRAQAPEPAAAPTAPHSAPAEPEQEPPPPPNILLLMTDDQTLADMAALPGTRAWFGRKGTTFRRAFASYPLCCPARVSVLTGRFAHNHKVLGNEPPWGGATLFDDREALPVWLRRAGYRTAYVGKYLNGYPEPGRETDVAPGWDEWVVPALDIYDYEAYRLNVNGRLEPPRGYQADFVGESVSRLVTRWGGGERPFFVWGNFLAPHAGLPVEPDDPRAAGGPTALDTPAVADRHRDAFSRLRLPEKPSLNEADMSDKGSFLQDRPLLPVDELREQYQQRRESLLAVDEAVGRILGALRRAGEVRDTLVVLTSDNGFLLGEHRWDHKILGYEESIRVPLLLAGPGVARGVRRDQVVSLVDLTATLVEAAGARVPWRLDGISLRPLTSDQEVARRRTLLLEAGGWPFPRARRLYTGVRTSDELVLLRWLDGTEEVYDLRRDPFQLDGRADRRERRLLPRLRRELEALSDCVGRPCWGLRG